MSKASESDAELGGLPSSLRVALIFSGFLGTVAVLLFLPAGRLDWQAGWLYLALVSSSVALAGLYVRCKNPVLIKRRVRIGKGTETWDKIWLAFFAPLYLAVYVVAGLDAVRFGWSSMPGLLWPVGLALLLSGTMLYAWSMGVNPFFEQTVRIQTESGHRVIDTGPYRYVRHPGYVGMIGWLLSAPLLLGSWWAFLPSVLSVAAFVVRTALEDRTLHGKLPGYAEYACRVRYRLIPKLW